MKHNANQKNEGETTRTQLIKKKIKQTKKIKETNKKSGNTKKK